MSALRAKSFAELGETVHNAGLHVASSADTAPTSTTTPAVTPIAGFPTLSLGSPSSEDPQKVKEFRKAVDAFVEEMKPWVERFGKTLAVDREDLAYHMEALLADELKIANSIQSMNGHGRKVLEAAYMDAMIAAFPDNEIALNHIADQGYLIKYLRVLEEGEDKNFAYLPATAEGGKVQYFKLTSERLDATRIIKALMAKAAKVRKDIEDANRQKALEIGRGTRLLFATLNSRKGEAVCFVPPSKGNDRPALRIRIRVDGNTVIAVMAIGDESVEELVGVSIPLESLRTNTFPPDLRRQTDEEQWRKMISLRKTIQAAIQHEYAIKGAQEEVTELRKKATVSIQDFDRGAQGIAVVSLESWREFTWVPQTDGTYKKGDFVAAHRNIPFAIERNDKREIRLVACLKQHQGLFPPDCRKFTSERSSGPVPKKQPYDGLGIFGVMLRGVHFNVERDRRKGTDAHQQSGVKHTPHSAGASDTPQAPPSSDVSAPANDE